MKLMSRKDRMGYRQMARLNDRQLNDIGLHRGDIPTRFTNEITPFTSRW